MSSIGALTKGSASYQASSIPNLESYLSSQVDGSAEYNFDVNRTLAKLYKCFPSLAKTENYTAMLQLSLQQFPYTNDFVALLSLTPEIYKVSCSSIIHSSELLEAAKFEEFWNCYPNKGDKKIQSGIIKLFSNVFSKVGTDVLAKALGGITFDETIALAKSQSDVVKSADGSFVEFLPNTFNCKDITSSSTTSKEQGISMDSVTHILHARSQ